LQDSSPSGTPELTAAVIKALGERSGVLLAHHGALGTGGDMREAFTACEIIEKTAHVYLLALSAGRVDRLPPAGINAMKAIYDKRHQSKCSGFLKINLTPFAPSPNGASTKALISCLERGNFYLLPLTLPFPL
jgi:hypothetical protein